MGKGLVQIYTGDGKGKTTAAMGLAFRALGQGLKVCIIQFLKPSGISSGEYKISRQFKKSLTFKRLNTPWWSLKSMARESDKKRMQAYLKRLLPKIENLLTTEEFDLVILDEINICLSSKLIDIDDFIELIKKKSARTELILTGRRAPEEIIALADLVTEMKMIKHPYNSGQKARKGIEF